LGAALCKTPFRKEVYLVGNTMDFPPTPNRIRSSTERWKGTASEIDIFSFGETDVVYNYDVDFPKLVLTEECYSENHPGYNKLGKGEKGDLGGPFYVFRNKFSIPPVPSSYEKVTRHARPDGYVDIVEKSHGLALPLAPTLLQFPAIDPVDVNLLNQWGAEAIYRSAPGQSSANLMQSLVEIRRDGLPSHEVHTWKDRAHIARSAGDDYLNVQFGWLPLVSDIKSTANAVLNFSKIQAQLRRDSGKIVRRKLNLLDDTKSVTTKLADMASANISGIAGIPTNFKDGPLWKTRTTSHKVWFSGAFTYYLPSLKAMSNVEGQARDAARIFGLNLTPSTIWSLTPWSWAIDFVTDSKEVISNAQRFLSGELVLHHGYIMEHRSVEDSYFIEGGPIVGLMTEYKLRYKANPYGFGVDFSDLSDFQISILAALGLSRSG